jgi:hypothetical protein
MQNEVKRGRPRKTVETPQMKLNVKTVKMDDLTFNDKLFTPMRTKTKVDQFFSSDKGV